MLDVAVVTDVARLASLKSEWNRLWQEGGAGTPYQSWEWNYSWAASSAKGAAPFVVTVRDSAGALRGVAPLESDRLCGVFRRVRFTSQGASIYPDFIVQPGMEEPVLRTVARFLLRDAAVDMVDLIVAEPSLSLPHLTGALEESGWRNVSAADYTKRLVVDLGGSYDEYLATLSGKMRQEMRSEVKKIAARHRVEFHATGDESELEDGMRTLFRLNALKWGGDPEKKHPQRRACYRALRGSGGARIFTLTCDGTPVAALSALVAGGTVFAEIAGFDYCIGKFDLGKILYHHLFLWALQNGFRRIDFSSGEEPYKFRYNPSVFSKWRLLAYRGALPLAAATVEARGALKAKEMRAALFHSPLYRSTPLHGLYLRLKQGGGK